MNSPPNLRHLYAALEVHRLGSISRAADRVHLSQSAITQGLSRLEQELGADLFTRTPSGLFASEVGEIFLQRINRAVDHLTGLDTLFTTRTDKRAIKLTRRLTTTQLRALVSVTEHSSYTLAANHLNLSQPSVHRAIKDLEAVCQNTLFQRSPAGVEPSWQARRAARLVSLFFAELEQGYEEVDEFLGINAGSLRVGCLPLARTRLAPHTVTLLLEEFPAAKVSIIDGPYEEQLNSLLHGQLDIIVGALREPAPSPHITQEFLFQDPLHLVVRPGHPLATRPAKNAKALRDLSWIAPRKNTPAREVFTRFFSDRGLTPPDHLIECSSLVATRSLLLESDRAALLPARQVEVDVQMGLLAVSPQQLAGTSRDIGITLRKDWSPTHLQSRFLELLKNQ